jgi:RimJ/RimL family protein N-acetyltransferase
VAAIRARRLRRPPAGPHDHGAGPELTAPPAIETERLRLEPVAEGELPVLLEVFLGNPEYLEWTEGGDYDLGMLQRDWEVARVDPQRHMLALRERATGELVGVIEYLDHNERDGHPWIGLIMVASARQREGFAAEAMGAVADQIHMNWASPLRLAVIDQNTAGMQLALALGFEPYGEAEQPLGGGWQRLVLMQRRI